MKRSQCIRYLNEHNCGCVKHEIILYWSKEDNSFIAEVPELPGCMADGENPFDAIKKVYVVIEEWIKTAKHLGREIPKPKGRLMFA